MRIVPFLCLTLLCSAICLGGEDFCGFEQLGGSFDENFFLRINKRVSDGNAMEATQALGSNHEAKEWYEYLLKTHSPSDALEAALLIGKGEIDAHFYSDITSLENKADAREVARELRDPSAQQFYLAFRKKDGTANALKASSLVQDRELDGNFYLSIRKHDDPDFARKVAKKLVGQSNSQWVYSAARQIDSKENAYGITKAYLRGELDYNSYAQARKRVDSDTAREAMTELADHSNAREWYLYRLGKDSARDALNLAKAVKRGNVDPYLYEKVRGFDPPEVALRVATELSEAENWKDWYVWLRRKTSSRSAMNAIRAGLEKRISWDFYVGLLKTHDSDGALRLALSAGGSGERRGERP